ncbi:MAG: hypothetical protein VYE81_02775 [Planctomycetota bacterium]|nr:hypothetical protein [Planctomycetota bacterium]
MTNCDLCGGIGSSPFLTKGDLAYVPCTVCGFVQADMRPEEFAAKANDPRRRRRYHKRIEVRILKRYPSRKNRGRAGFSEIELRRIGR